MFGKRDSANISVQILMCFGLQWLAPVLRSLGLFAFIPREAKVPGQLKAPRTALSYNLHVRVL